jgi:phosphopantetheinyl transferase
MNITLTIQPNYRILIAEVTETIEELLSLLKNFNDYESEFYEINALKRKKEFISVRILMNILMEKNVIVRYDNDHKPILTNQKEQISISHSGNWFALISSTQSQPGIDIEKRTNRVRAVSNRFLSESEYNFLRGDDLTDGLEIAWSAKECLYKRIGNMAYDFHKIQLSPFSVTESGSFNATFIPNNTGFKLYYSQNELYTVVYSI